MSEGNDTISKRPKRPHSSMFVPFLIRLACLDMDAEFASCATLHMDSVTPQNIRDSNRPEAGKYLLGFLDEPPKKKARAPKAKTAPSNGPRGRRGNTGKLAKLMEISPDIFFEVRALLFLYQQIGSFIRHLTMEVASYLHPRDLLRLGRTNKFIRNTVVSKSFRQIWKTALSSIEVPFPPESIYEQLSEPGLSALLFDRDCSIPVSAYFLRGREFYY